jgi:hypothetical protein
MADSPTKRQTRRPRRASSILLNCLTLIVLLLTCVGGLVVVALFQYPGLLAYIPGGSAYMPQPGPATAVAFVPPTPLPISTDASGQPVYPTFPATWTPENTPTVTLTPGPGTAVSSSTATRTPTATKLPPTATRITATPTRTGPTPTQTGTLSPFRYTLQPGNPTYLTNFLNDQGCKWFGIVGRAFTIDGNPRLNLTVHLEGGGLIVDALTGSGPPALGPGGYQIPIADHPIATTDVYRVTLRDNTGIALSTEYSIPTFGDCDKAMVMVNFVQNH